ncbi:EscU/YscU/HrcU family type III secretion system export apparatus switch protein [Nitrincola schmidtii]|uniref:EscU/YscU/HrcU family type III secretion system export apparatus switch protein n=1 Tax=Nitrincola schmidtii TaxID=1730894 RepID=UPI00124DC761|nr:EscU/YscU/HrcU family type III secretion system export apparatus switch protein [Nitrincola schmidtii]
MKITVKDDVSKKQAVALKYDQEKGTAPKVIAKGKGLIAEQIIALAEEHDIHIHENPELLEVLIRLELGDEIPETLYKAIAEVIAFAYNLKHSTPNT